MAKLRDRITVITDLLLGAVHADHVVERAELDALRKTLRELLGVAALPSEVETRITEFSTDKFDVGRVVADFASDPPIKKRRLLELVAIVRDADGEIDLAEDGYLVSIATALNMKRIEYEDLVLDYEIEDLRGDFEALRMSDIEIDVEG